MVNCNLNKDYKAEADINELSAYMENGYELVDVRDELSYAYGNIKGSVNLSKDALCEHADDYAGRKLLLYCKRGEASLEAAEVLREHGADAVSLRGGYLAWLMADMQQRSEEKSDDEFAAEVEESIRKRFKKSIWSKFTKAINEYELVKVRIYDLTGLFYVHKKIKRFADIQVLPELDAVAVQVSERVRRYFGEAESYDDFQPGTDVSQIFDVREYRPGDRLQRIHWKLSAKSDGLLVREDSQPLACAVVFLLDMLPQMAGKGRHMRRSREAYAETFLTIAADLVYSMMDAGCPHYVAWQEETEIKRLRVEDEESVYLFLMQFMECQKETAGSLRQRYEQQYRCEHPVHRLELTPELFLVLDGQTLADFGGDNWRQKLEEMELVL
mgnify:CR=1 FL=1